MFIERNTHLNINGTIRNGTVYTLLQKRPIKCNLEMSGELGYEYYMYPKSNMRNGAQRGATVRNGAQRGATVRRAVKRLVN